MKYASENPCAALSCVAFPPAIFCVARAIGSRALPTTVGFTPSRSSRVENTTWVSARWMVSIAVNDDTLDAWYSARPESTIPSVRMRNPSKCFAST